MTPPPSTPSPFTTCVLLAGLTGMPSAAVLCFFCPLSMHVLCVPLFSWWRLLSFAFALHAVSCDACRPFEHKVIASGPQSTW